MKGQEPTATHIEVRLSDATTLYSESSEHAQEIWNWWGGCETLAAIHGAKYAGRPLGSRDATTRRFKHTEWFGDTTDYVELAGTEVTTVLKDGTRNPAPHITPAMCEEFVADGEWLEL